MLWIRHRILHILYLLQIKTIRNLKTQNSSHSFKLRAVLSQYRLATAKKRSFMQFWCPKLYNYKRREDGFRICFLFYPLYLRFFFTELECFEFCHITLNFFSREIFGSQSNVWLLSRTFLLFVEVLLITNLYSKYNFYDLITYRIDYEWIMKMRVEFTCERQVNS